MASKRTWMSLVCCAAAFAAAGCESSKPGEIGTLPMPELDFSPGSPVGGAGPGPASPARPPGREWRHIVIHHSATERGSAAVFDRAHRKRGWDELGYHFVIDNGHGGPDGRIEVGSRWRSQKWGAHTGGTPGNEYNEHGIGICLVGNFQNHAPTPKQLASLRRLVGHLAAECGIPPGRIIGHRDAPNARTACPGHKLHRYIHTTLRPEVARLGAWSR